MSSRRDRIDRVNRAREDAGATPMRRGWLTFWCTRDASGGVVRPIVRVWLRAPHRTVLAPVPSLGLPRATFWYASREPDEDGQRVSALYAEWSLEECQKLLGTIPDDDRQCLRKEGTGGVGNAPPLSGS